MALGIAPTLFLSSRRRCLWWLTPSCHDKRSLANAYNTLLRPRKRSAFRHTGSLTFYIFLERRRRSCGFNRATFPNASTLYMKVSTGCGLERKLWLAKHKNNRKKKHFFFPFFVLRTTLRHSWTSPCCHSFFLLSF